MNWKHELQKDWRNKWKRLIRWAWMLQACWFLDCYSTYFRSFCPKDFASNFMQGLKFRFNPAFNEGDEVLLDGEQSIIVKKLDCVKLYLDVTDPLDTHGDM